MGDEQGALFAMSPQEAVQQEIGRIAQVVVRLLPDEGDMLRVFALKIMMDAVPGMTRARWQALAGPVAPERTCECDECEGAECQGDCESCDDHGCEQCYANHSVSDCCGYCEDCDEHPDDTNSDCVSRCAECDHCSECDHYCQ